MMTIPVPTKKRFFTKWWFWLLIVLGLLSVLGVLTGIAAFKKAERASYGYLEESVAVEKRSFSKTISTSGIVVPDETTHLSASIPGTVNTVHVAVGDSVKKNDILVEIGSNDMKAPFDGRIVSLETFEGDVVQPGVPLVEVGYNSSHIEFFASDAEAIELEVGKNASITVPSFQNGKTGYESTVTFVDRKKRTAAPSTASQAGETGYLVHLSTSGMPATLTEIIGLNVDAIVTVGEIADAVSIVSGAIQYDDDGNAFVYRLPAVTDTFIQQARATENVTQLLQKQQITTGFQGDEYTEIIEGLESGEQVLLYIPAVKASLPF